MQQTVSFSASRAEMRPKVARPKLRRLSGNSHPRYCYAKRVRTKKAKTGPSLEPLELVPPNAVSPRVLKMLDQSAENLRKRLTSPPIDLTPFRLA